MINEKNSARDNGYENNKDVVFDYIQGIYIENFRSFKDREVKLGRYLTVVTGKNGTMKSSLLGLLAHPFDSPNNARDAFDNALKTKMQDVFKLSKEYDASCNYTYYLNARTNTGIEFSEKIRMYERPDPQAGTTRFRITVSRANDKGLGNFLLNTSFVNLKRLYPIIDTKAKVLEANGNKALYSTNESKWIANAYYRVIQRKSFKETVPVEDKNIKTTYGPKGSYYDFQSMSSGEDNLGAIFNKMLAFMKYKSADKSALNGIFCIDEVEASLHPVSQTALIDFLFDWAKKYNIQVVVTTHSLHVIYHCLELQRKLNKEKEYIVLNNISTMGVGKDNNYNIMINPSYDVLHKELTFESLYDKDAQYKVNLICEDVVARDFINKILSRKTVIKKSFEFLLDIGGGKSGDSYKSLISLAKNGRKILKDSVIVLDPDVDNKSLEGCDSNYIFKIPDCDDKNFPIEKRIVVFIESLDGSDAFFKDKEKMSIEASFGAFGIDPTDLDTKNIEPYKKWMKSNKSLYNKALSLYIRHNKPIFEKFIQDLVEKINVKRSRYSLHPIMQK